MVNKKGWLRIIEAVVGIMIIASVLLSAYTRTSKQEDISAGIYLLEEKILNELAVNYRNDILTIDLDFNNKMEMMNNSVRENLTADFDFELRICYLTDNSGDTASCQMQGNVNGNVYVRERIIGANLEQYSPKKIKLFLWRI